MQKKVGYSRMFYILNDENFINDNECKTLNIKFTGNNHDNGDK